MRRKYHINYEMDNNHRFVTLCGLTFTEKQLISRTRNSILIDILNEKDRWMTKSDYFCESCESIYPVVLL